MVEINVSYCKYLIELLDELLSDLKVSNPEYSTAFDVGNNETIRTLTNEVGHLPFYYALPTSRGVTFDIKKLEDLRIELLARKSDAIKVAFDVIDFELNRLKARDEISYTLIQDRFQLIYQDQLWSGSAEHIIRNTMSINYNLDSANLWKLITT